MKKALIALPLAGALSTGAVVSATASDSSMDKVESGGFVQRCSLVGINPAHHPKIFGNPAVAATYGFVRSANGAWQVRPGCR
jgi:hypothetical protein